MARLIALRTESRGIAECLASFDSIGEAASHAHKDADLLRLECDGNVITFQGMALTTMAVEIEGATVVLTVSPAPALILFAAWFMSVLPSRASVVWSKGWRRSPARRMMTATSKMFPRPL